MVRLSLCFISLFSAFSLWSDINRGEKKEAEQEVLVNPVTSPVDEALGFIDYIFSAEEQKQDARDFLEAYKTVLEAEKRKNIYGASFRVSKAFCAAGFGGSITWLCLMTIAMTPALAMADGNGAYIAYGCVSGVGLVGAVVGCAGFCYGLLSGGWYIKNFFIGRRAQQQLAVFQAKIDALDEVVRGHGTTKFFKFNTIYADARKTLDEGFSLFTQEISATDAVMESGQVVDVPEAFQGFVING